MDEPGAYRGIGYLLAAYGVVIVTLIGYGIYLSRQRRALRREVRNDPGRSPG